MRKSLKYILAVLAFAPSLAHADLRWATPLMLLYSSNTWYVTQVFNSSTTFVDGRISVNGVGYTWPNSLAAGNCLQTDGSGNLSWAPCGSGGVGGGGSLSYFNGQQTLAVSTVALPGILSSSLSGMTTFYIERSTLNPTVPWTFYSTTTFLAQSSFSAILFASSNVVINSTGHYNIPLQVGPGGVAPLSSFVTALFQDVRNTLGISRIVVKNAVDGTEFVFGATSKAGQVGTFTGHPLSLRAGDNITVQIDTGTNGGNPFVTMDSPLYLTSSFLFPAAASIPTSMLDVNGGSITCRGAICGLQIGGVSFTTYMSTVAAAIASAGGGSGGALHAGRTAATAVSISSALFPDMNVVTSNGISTFTFTNTTPTLTGPWNFQSSVTVKQLGSGQVWASQFPGLECGAKINQVVNSFADTPVEILVDQACGTIWQSTVALKWNHVLKFVQPGVYKTSGSITGGHIKGTGGPGHPSDQVTVIYQEDGANLPYQVRIATRGGSISDIMVFGNKLKNSGATYGIAIDSAATVSITNVWQIYASSDGLLVTSPDQITNISQAPFIRNSVFQLNGGNGVSVYRTSDLFLQSSLTTQNDGYGIYLQDGGGARINLGDIGLNTKGGIYVSGTPGGRGSNFLNITSNQFGNNYSTDVYVNGYEGGQYLAFGGNISANTFFTNTLIAGSADCINLDGTFGWNVTGNNISAVSGHEYRTGITETGAETQRNVYGPNSYLGAFTSAKTNLTGTARYYEDDAKVSQLIAESSATIRGVIISTSGALLGATTIQSILNVEGGNVDVDGRSGLGGSGVGLYYDKVGIPALYLTIRQQGASGAQYISNGTGGGFDHHRFYNESGEIFNIVNGGRVGIRTPAPAHGFDVGVPSMFRTSATVQGIIISTTGFDVGRSTVTALKISGLPGQGTIGTDANGNIVAGSGGSSGPAYHSGSLGGMASGLLAGGTDFASLESTNSVRGQQFYVRAFDGATTEYMKLNFRTHEKLHLAGNVTFYATIMAKTAAASKNVQIMFLSSASPSANWTGYTVSTGAIFALSPVQCQKNEVQWSVPVSMLGWGQGQYVEAAFSRPHNTALLADTELSGDLYWINWKIAYNYEP